MKRNPVLLAIVLSAFCITQSWGWGQTGHRVVGQIAEMHLTAKAKKSIEKLLGKESLAIAATWMDEVRSDDAYDYTHDWHWVTIPKGKTYKQTEKNPNGDLIEAIGRMKAKLESDTVSREKKVEALKFLIHLVGDIHQPMHVGTGEDKGGNDVKIKWFYKPSNLHRIWDSEMIDEKQLSYTELAGSINHSSPQEVAMLQQGTPADWALEAMIHRPQIYDIEGEESLGYEYMYHNWEVVESQLEKAGIRLAGMLNEIFK